MIHDDYLEYTSNGVPYEWQLYNQDGAAFTILINMDDPENIPTNQQIADAKSELIATHDVVRLAVVQYKDGEYKLIETRKRK